MFEKQVIPKIDYKNQIKFYKQSFIDFSKTKSKMFGNKFAINNFFNFYKFVLIYFFIGNFYIRKKISKMIRNVINTNLNFIKISRISDNLKTDILFLIESIKGRNNINYKNTLFFINSKYYLPKTIFINNYNFFFILNLYLKNIKLIFNFFTIYLLKLNYSLIDQFSKLKKNKELVERME